jgi:hypothetical protein
MLPNFFFIPTMVYTISYLAKKALCNIYRMFFKWEIEVDAVMLYIIVWLTCSVTFLLSKYKFCTASFFSSKPVNQSFNEDDNLWMIYSDYLMTAIGAVDLLYLRWTLYLRLKNNHEAIIGFIKSFHSHEKRSP